MWKIIDKLWLFLQNIFSAFKFAAYDYDVVLQRTKTPRQRLIIWIVIATVIVFLIIVLLIFIGKFFQIIFKNGVRGIYDK